MIDMLLNLAVFLAGAATSATIGYALWRVFTHPAAAAQSVRHPPAE